MLLHDHALPSNGGRRTPTKIAASRLFNHCINNVVGEQASSVKGDQYQRLPVLPTVISPLAVESKGQTPALDSHSLEGFLRQRPPFFINALPQNACKALMDLERRPLATLSLTLLLNYCQEQGRGMLKQLQKPEDFQAWQRLVLEHNAITQLNVLPLSGNLSGHRLGSLFNIFASFTSTAMGYKQRHQGDFLLRYNKHQSGTCDHGIGDACVAVIVHHTDSKLAGWTKLDTSWYLYNVWPALRHLHLDSILLSRESTTALVSCSLPGLQKLSLTSCSISQPAATQLGKGSWPNLESLALCNSQLSLQAMLDGCWPFLKRLDVSHTIPNTDHC